MNLTEYMSNSIDAIVKTILSAAFDNPKESAFLLKYMAAQKSSAKIRKQYEKNGHNIPPFLIASITSECNLFCKGCYARANKSCCEKPTQQQLSCERWSELFKEAKVLGISFILLAGGEPMMRRDVIEAASKTKEIIFPIFTNSTLLDDDYINLLNQHRNLVPILSIEGNQEQTDERRGKGTYALLIKAMDSLNNHGIFYGSSVTVTTENIDTVTQEEFIAKLYHNGCKIVFFVEYVPVTSCTKKLAPSNLERKILAERKAVLQTKFKDMLFLSFPGDEKVTEGCLAAGRGFFHINAVGGAEPCPFSPYSDTNLKEVSLLQALKSPLFRRLNEQGMLLGEHDGGCLLFEKENEVKSLITK